VLHLVIAAGGVDRFAEADDGSLADELAQRLQVVLGELGIDAVQAVDARLDGEAGRRLRLLLRGLRDAGRENQDEESRGPKALLHTGLPFLVTRS